MVDFLYNYFFKEKYIFNTLSKISNEMCDDNGKKYIDFDNFPNYINIVSTATTDTLLLNLKENYIVFVEFKSFEKVKDFNKWFNRTRKQQIYLKAYESFLTLEQLIITHSNFDHNDYYNLDKRFIFVYNGKDAKKRIRRHIQGKIKRFKFIFDEKVFTMRCEGFKKILGDKNLC
jgi:hypothetical protein